MNIGIDIDDTIVNTAKSMIKYADKYNIEILGGEGAEDKFGKIQSHYYLDALYGWDRKTKFDFFDMYYKNVLEECVPLPDAANVIQKLKSEGNNIYFITARITGIKDCDTELLTKKTLANNNIPFDKLILNSDDKAKSCIENGVQLFIDDSYSTCNKLEENGIKPFLMTTTMNQKIDNGNVERVSNWKEIYNKIHEYID